MTAAANPILVRQLALISTTAIPYVNEGKKREIPVGTRGMITALASGTVTVAMNFVDQAGDVALQFKRDAVLQCFDAAEPHLDPVLSDFYAANLNKTDLGMYFTLHHKDKLVGEFKHQDYCAAPFFKMWDKEANHLISQAISNAVATYQGKYIGHEEFVISALADYIAEGNNSGYLTFAEYMDWQDRIHSL